MRGRFKAFWSWGILVLGVGALYFPGCGSGGGGTTTQSVSIPNVSVACGSTPCPSSSTAVFAVYTAVTDCTQLASISSNYVVQGTAQIGSSGSVTISTWFASGVTPNASGTNNQTTIAAGSYNLCVYSDTLGGTSGSFSGHIQSGDYYGTNSGSANGSVTVNSASATISVTVRTQL